MVGPLRDASLSSLVLIKADGALGDEALGPVAVEFNIGLRNPAVSKQKPEAEDWLGENVEDGVGDDLGIDRCFPGSIGNAPHTEEQG